MKMRSPKDEGSAGFTVELDSRLAPDEALRRVLDLRQHDRIIPFTRVEPALPADQLVAGTEFTARTGVGPLAFNDRMRVEQIAIGAAESGAVISKHAPVIGGTIRLTVTASGSGSRLLWRQRVLLPWLPRFVQPVAARIIRLGYRRVLSRLLATDPMAGQASNR